MVILKQNGTVDVTLAEIGTMLLALQNANQAIQLLLRNRRQINHILSKINESWMKMDAEEDKVRANELEKFK